MKQLALSCAILVLPAATADAWNDKGRIVVARMVWNDVAPTERSKDVDILRSHPHYGEFLKDRRPKRIPEDRWVFLRTATWADWVRGGRHRSTPDRECRQAAARRLA